MERASTCLPIAEARNESALSDPFTLIPIRSLTERNLAAVRGRLRKGSRGGAKGIPGVGRSARMEAKTPQSDRMTESPGRLPTCRFGKDRSRGAANLSCDSLSRLRAGHPQWYMSQSAAGR